MPKIRCKLTLTELLTSLAIVSLVGAILLPGIFTAQRNNNLTLCLSNLNAIGRALRLYNQDYDERMPAAFVTITPINRGDTNAIPYDMQLLPYMKTKLRTFACPSDTTHITTDPHYGFWDGSMHPPYYRRSYAYVSTIFTQSGQPDSNTGMSQWSFGYPLSIMDNLAETIAIVEAWTEDRTGIATMGAVGSPWGSLFTSCDTWQLPGRMKPAVSSIDLPPPGCEDLYNDVNLFPSVGHNQLGNYLMADGHVKTLSWQKVRSNDFQLFKLRK